MRQEINKNTKMRQREKEMKNRFKKYRRNIKMEKNKNEMNMRQLDENETKIKTTPNELKLGQKNPDGRSGFVSLTTVWTKEAKIHK